MKLYVNENIWSESIEIKSKEGLFTKELIVITLIFILVIVELPIILLLLKKFFQSKGEFIIYITLFIVVILGIFLIFFISSPPKLFLIRASKARKTLELGWIKNLIRKEKQFISFDRVRKMRLSIYKLKDEYKIRLSLENINGDIVNLSFELNASYNEDELNNIFLNIAHIMEFKSYTASSRLFGRIISFSKGLDERIKINENTGKLIFEEEKTLFETDKLNIPHLIIKQLNPLKIVLYKKPYFYDILRLIFVLFIFPIIIFLAFLSKEPQKYIPIIFAFFGYAIVLYFIRRLISPMETTIDKLRNMVKIKKLFFSISFPIQQISQIEISDQLSKRTGMFIFHVDLRLKNGKTHQIFYTEFAYKKEKIYEVYENINILLSFLNEYLGFPVVDKTKHLP